MTCLSPIALALFLSAVGLDIETRYPLVIVLSEIPRLYVWRGYAFCHGGVAV